MCIDAVSAHPMHRKRAWLDSFPVLYELEGFQHVRNQASDLPYLPKDVLDTVVLVATCLVNTRHLKACDVERVMNHIVGDMYIVSH